jgi:hypothetical protein
MELWPPCADIVSRGFGVSSTDLCRRVRHARESASLRERTWEDDSIQIGGRREWESCRVHCSRRLQLWRAYVQRPQPRFRCTLILYTCHYKHLPLGGRDVVAFLNHIGDSISLHYFRGFLPALIGDLGHG